MKWIKYLKDELIEKLMREKIMCARINKTKAMKVFQEIGIPVKFE